MREQCTCNDQASRRMVLPIIAHVSHLLDLVHLTIIIPFPSRGLGRILDHAEHFAKRETNAIQPIRALGYDNQDKNSFVDVLLVASAGFPISGKLSSVTPKDCSECDHELVVAE